MVISSSEISFRNFHTVLNQAFDQALEQNGLPQSQLHDKSVLLRDLMQIWKEPIAYDSASARGSFLERTMAVLPQLANDLKSQLRIDKANISQSLNSACTRIEELLRSRIMNPLKKFAEDSSGLQRNLRGEIIKLKQEKSRANKAVKPSPGPVFGRPRVKLRSEAEMIDDEIKVKEGMIKTLEEVVDFNRMFVGGLNNACKTYLGFARLVIQKLFERGCDVGAEQIKTVIKNNKEVMLRLARLAMPLLMLFDNINGVNIDSVAPYNYNPDNFELVQDDGAEKLVPKQAMLHDFMERTSDVANTKATRCVNDKDETSTHTLLAYMQENKFKTSGCVAFQEGLMDRFFVMMDGMIGKLVDMHFAAV